MIFVVALVAVLALYNNATALLGLPSWAYVPVNLVATAVLLLVARSRGYGWAQLGLDRAAVVPGLVWGAGAFLVVGAALAVAWFLPFAAPLFADQRVAGLTAGGLLHTTLVRIPLGTALWEEIAFRGVLYGVWSAHASPVAAVVGSSVVFGIWHIGPSIQLLRDNEVALHASTVLGAVGASVAITTIAGVVFCYLRIRTGGVVAPVLAHVATNSLGTVAAFLFQRSTG